MPEMKIDVDQWAAELRRVSAGTALGLSCREIATATGRCMARTQEILRRLFDCGRVTVAIGTRSSMDGRVYRCPLYTIKPDAARQTMKTTGKTNSTNSSKTSRKRGGRKQNG